MVSQSGTWIRAFTSFARLLAATALMAVPAAAAGPPDHLSLGVGRYDQADLGINLLWFDQGREAGSAAAWELRLERRFGGSWGWAPSEGLELRPWISLEVTDHGSTWAGGGGIAEVLAGPVVLGASLGAGLFDRGRGRALGYPLEFRTGLEAGLRLAGEMRLSAGFYHLSNAEIRPDDNPGANTLVLYLHLPMAGLR